MPRACSPHKATAWAQVGHQHQGMRPQDGACCGRGPVSHLVWLSTVTPPGFPQLSITNPPTRPPTHLVLHIAGQARRGPLAVGALDALGGRAHARLDAGGGGADKVVAVAGRKIVDGLGVQVLRLHRCRGCHWAAAAASGACQAPRRVRHTQGRTMPTDAMPRCHGPVRDGCVARAGSQCAASHGCLEGAAVAPHGKQSADA